MALNQMEQLHLKWQVPLSKDPALPFLPPWRPEPFALWSERETPNSQSEDINWVDICFLLSPGWSFWLCSVVLNITYVYFKDAFVAATQKQTATELANCQHAFSGISLKKEKADKRESKREKRHFIVLYIWKYMSEYWKKMYMLTNLW